MDPSHLTQLVQLEDNYWWHVAKRKLVLRLLNRFAPAPGRLVEGGIGSGRNLVEFDKQGYNVTGFDLMPGREPEMPDGHAKTVYTFGGNWMAKPVWPEGILVNEKYGRSSNQQMLTAPEDVPLRPDDFVFFRPTQSEAVFLQFGDIAVFENEKIVERWPVFKASA